MNEEPELDQVRDDDNEAATKGELRAVEKSLETKIKAEGEETRRHFDMAVEHIEDLVLGANQDEISLIKDQQLPDHEERIQTLEKKTGVTVGPRHES